MEKIVDYLFVIGLCQFLLHICILILKFHLLQGKFNILWFFNCFFLVNNSGGVFLLRILVSARFFPAVQTICKLGSFNKVS